MQTKPVFSQHFLEISHRHTDTISTKCLLHGEAYQNCMVVLSYPDSTGSIDVKQPYVTKVLKQ